MALGAPGALVEGRSSTLTRECKCTHHTPMGGPGPAEDLVKKRQGTRALKGVGRLSIYWSACFFPYLP